MSASDSKKSHTLILVRHGESQWNKLHKFAGWVDIPLSPKGEKEAHNAANLIKKANFKPNALYTSKLTRSCVSGEIILQDLNRSWVDVSKSWRLNERHYGNLQGKSKSEVLAAVGKEKYMFWRRAFDGVPPLADEQHEFLCVNDERYQFCDITTRELPRGESLKMVLERLIPYFQEKIKLDLLEGKTVLVVAHGSTIRALIKYLQKVSDDDIASLNIPTGIPLVFDLDQNMIPLQNHYYLDPEAAIAGAKEVGNQGFSISN